MIIALPQIVSISEQRIFCISFLKSGYELFKVLLTSLLSFIDTVMIISIINGMWNK